MSLRTVITATAAALISGVACGYVMHNPLLGFMAFAATLSVGLRGRYGALGQMLLGVGIAIGFSVFWLALHALGVGK